MTHTGAKTAKNNDNDNTNTVNRDVDGTGQKSDSKHGAKPPSPPSPPRRGRDAFLDGCHRYGWLISPLITGLMFAYFMGGLNRSVTSLEARMSTVESTVVQILMKK